MRERTKQEASNLIDCGMHDFLFKLYTYFLLFSVNSFFSALNKSESFEC